MAAGGSSCTAGLLIKLPPPAVGCDIHPSAEGRALLAQAIVSTIAASRPGDVTACLDRNPS